MRTLPHLVGYLRDDFGKLGRVEVFAPDEITYDVDMPEPSLIGGYPWWAPPTRRLILTYNDDSTSVVLRTTELPEEESPIFDALAASRELNRKDE